MHNKQRGRIDIIEAAIIIAILAAVLAVFLVPQRQCHQRARMMQLNSSWGPIQGCMVRVDKRWSPIEYIRIVDGKVSIQGDGG